MDDDFLHKIELRRRPSQRKLDYLYNDSLKYLRQPPGDEFDYGLCIECRSIDFRKLFSQDQMNGDVQQEVLLLSEVQGRGNRDCHLCQLFQGTANLVGMRQPTGLQLVASYQSILHAEETLPGSYVYLAGSFPEKPTCILGATNWRTEQPKPPPILSACSQYLKSKSVLYSKFTNEIKYCAALDKGSAKVNLVSTAVSQMTVLHCRKRKVVAYDGRSDYLALSYVWGQQSRSQARSNVKGKLEKKSVPQTIEDAITVTLELGKKFLWVDRYCVDQVDNGRMHDQINEMSYIFSHAWATIVSLGADDQSPLPGVSMKRPKLRLVQTPHCDLLTPGITSEAAITESVWSTRAWTFQEARLSQRILLFTKSEVHLICKHAFILESLDGISHRSPKERRRAAKKGSWSVMSGPTLQFERSDTKSIFNYKDGDAALEEFCSRTLTMETDSLNAFRGALRKEHSDTGAFSYWGVSSIWPGHIEDTYGAPAGGGSEYNYLDKGLAWGLLWYKPDLYSHTIVDVANKTAPELCSVFPSWSWVSCRHHARLAVPLSMMDIDRRSLPIASALLDSPNGRIVPLSEAIPELGLKGEPGLVIPERHRHIWLRSRVIESAEPTLAEQLVSQWEVIQLLDDFKVTTSFLPDNRVCCASHVAWAREARITAALLILLDFMPNYNPANPNLVASAYWLGLLAQGRESNMTPGDQHWHRVGLVRTDFNVENVSEWVAKKGLKSVYRDGYEIKYCQEALERIIWEDLDTVAGRVKTMKLG
jgi:hypothetical protein